MFGVLLLASVGLFGFTSTQSVGGGGDDHSSRTVKVTSSYSYYPRPGTFAVEIPDSEHLNPEYYFYSHAVAADLVKKGFKKVSHSDSPQYELYTIYGDRRVAQATSTDDWYSYVYGYGSAQPTTGYIASLEFSLRDLSSEQVVLRAAAVTSTRSPVFAPVGMCLINSIFDRFPIPSGQVKIYNSSCV